MPNDVLAWGSSDNGVTVTPLPIDAATGAVKTTSPSGASGGNVTEGWGALSAGAVVLTGDGTGQSLKNLANAALIASAAQDNTSNKVANLNLDLRCKGVGAMIAGGTVDVWILTSLDGTNYEDGAAGTAPGRSPDALFFIRAVATAQILTLTGLLVPPTKYKVLVRNSTGQNLTNVDADNVLTAYTNP